MIVEKNPFRIFMNVLQQNTDKIMHLSKHIKMYSRIEPCLIFVLLAYVKNVK